MAYYKKRLNEEGGHQRRAFLQKGSLTSAGRIDTRHNKERSFVDRDHYRRDFQLPEPNGILIPNKQ